LFGYSTGIIAGAQLYLKDAFPEISTAQRSLCVSLTLLGAFFGSFIAGFSSKVIGRTLIIIISDVLFITGALTMAFAD
jgi:MFS family permease